MMGFFGGFVVGLAARPLGRLIAIFGALLLAGVVIDTAVLGHKGPPNTESSAQIERAVDGDTLVVRQSGTRERVRVLGINTPEVTGTPQCGGEAASRSAERWVAKNHIVTLRSDSAAPNRDRYGRLLRYVEPSRLEVQPGTDFSAVQVRRGHARVAAYGQDLDTLPVLRQLERAARRHGRGLWGGCR